MIEPKLRLKPSHCLRCSTVIPKSLTVEVYKEYSSHAEYVRCVNCEERNFFNISHPWQAIYMDEGTSLVFWFRQNKTVYYNGLDNKFTTIENWIDYQSFSRLKAFI